MTTPQAGSYGRFAAGSAMAKSGLAAITWCTKWIQTLSFIVISPMLGFILGSLMMVLVSNVFRSTRPSKVDKWFRRMQLVSAGAYSLGHGVNDAQKTIGIIWMLLIATGYVAAVASSPPGWVITSHRHSP